VRDARRGLMFGAIGASALVVALRRMLSGLPLPIGPLQVSDGPTGGGSKEDKKKADGDDKKKKKGGDDKKKKGGSGSSNGDDKKAKKGK
jgi:hypothetical protein